MLPVNTCDPKWLGMKESDLHQLGQNQLRYHYANPQKWQGQWITIPQLAGQSRSRFLYAIPRQKWLSRNASNVLSTVFNRHPAHQFAFMRMVLNVGLEPTTFCV